jgi:multicomponent K+:H+ antiporter subunit E
MFFIWLLAHNAVNAGLVVVGAVLAVVIPLATHPFWPEYPRRVRYRPLIRLLVVVLFDIMVANVRVALLILGPRSGIRPGFLILPLQVKTPHAIAMLAGIISLTPGTVSANLSGDRSTLLVHGLRLDDFQAATARIRSRYERPLLEIFEC